jgi:hypothetical protein
VLQVHLSGLLEEEAADVFFHLVDPVEGRAI